VNHREDDNTLFGQEIEEAKTTRERRVTNGAKVGRDGSGGGLEPRAGVLRRRRRAELMAVLVVQVEALSRRSFSFSTTSFV
jgi:hypothetical protein